MAKRTKGKRWLAGLLVALVVLGSAAVAGSALGKKDSIPPAGIIGPSDLPKHQTFLYRIDITPGSGSPTGWIEIQSFHWGVSQTSSSLSGGGGSAGKAEFKDLMVTKKLDKFSPMLVKDVATGAHQKKVVLEGYAKDANGSEVVYLRITLTDVLVSSYETGGEGGGAELPMETVDFNFAKVSYSYVGPDPSDSSTFTYDVSANKEA